MIKSLLILCLSIACFAQAPRENYILDQFLGFNRLSYKYNMEPKWTWDHLNGYIQAAPDGRGVLQQRSGLSKYNATVLVNSTTKTRYLFEARFDDGTTAAMCRAGTAWYRYASGDWTSLDGSRTSDAQGQAVMWENQVFMVDGGHPRKADSAWTVTDLSTDANLPADSSVIWVHGSRCWVNSDASPMIAYGSKAGLATGATDWTLAVPPDDAIQLDLSHYIPEGDKIVAYRSLGKEQLVIFLTKYIVIYDAPATFANIKISQVIKAGSASGFAIDQVGQDWLFPSQSGIKSLLASETSQNLDILDASAMVKPLYRDYFENAADTEDICGTYFNDLNHYYLTFQPSTGPAQTLVYSPELKNIVGRYEFHANPYSWLELRDGTLLVGMDNGFTYKYDDDEKLDDGSTIAWKYEPPHLGVFTLDRMKAPEEFEVLIEADNTTTFSLEYGFGMEDNAASTSTLNFTLTTTPSLWDLSEWDEAEWDQPGRDIIFERNMVGRGRSIYLSLSHKTSNSRIKIPYMIMKTFLEGPE